MILADIKEYLSQRGTASLSDISVHFDTDPDALRGMLNQWIRKGRVSKFLLRESCGDKCSKCDTNNTEIYQWVDTANNSFKGICIIPEHNKE